MQSLLSLIINTPAGLLAASGAASGWGNPDTTTSKIMLRLLGKLNVLQCKTLGAERLHISALALREN